VPRRHLAPFAIAVAPAVVLAVAGCSSGYRSSSATSSSVPAVTQPSTDSPLSTDGSTSGAGDSMHTDSSHVSRFDAPASVACTGTATVTVTYETVDLTTVAFVVDDATSGVQAPLSGTNELSLPCDGAVHTIMLIGTGPAGPAFASRVVTTQPA
jgi:hypothetical protein